MKLRVLLDSNVWRYAVDTGSQGRLLRLGREGNLDVQIAPGVVYEAMRLKEPELRRKLISLMVDRRFTRLMPEAYSESIEILDAVHALRPEWLRPEPDFRFFFRLKRDWTVKTVAGFWKRCALFPDTEAAYIEQLGGSQIDEAHLQSQVARKEMIDAGWKRNPSFDGTMAGFNLKVPGWDGDPVELWRIDSFVGLSAYLRQTGNAYRDWIAPFVNVDGGLLSSSSWTRFWLYNVDKSAVPRQWLRAAHSFAQRFRKVTTGSPGDTQLFTYLAETDLFVTGDKVLLDIIEECRPHSPVPLPTGVLVAGGRDGLADALSLLVAGSR